MVQEKKLNISTSTPHYIYIKYKNITFVTANDK